MSHHIELGFSVLPPGKEPASKKLQQRNAESTSAKRKETIKLDIDNKQMEWRLLQLKKAMAKEKEERGYSIFASHALFEAHAKLSSKCEHFLKSFKSHMILKIYARFFNSV